MKSVKGISLILCSIMITILAWNQSNLSRFTGVGVALTTLSLTFLLATRSQLLEKWFYGIENMYFYHKVLAIVSLLLLFFHNISMGGLWGNHFAAQLGNVAIYLFFSIIIVAFLGKTLKYEIWRFIHRFVFLAYLFGLAHAYLLRGGQLLQFNLLGITTAMFALVGIISAVYIIFFYRRRAFSYKGIVSTITHLNHDTVELEIELDRPLKFKFGQFAFIKIIQEGFETAPHPFSISGGKDTKIYFTIRKAGDYTNAIYHHLKIGSKVEIDRAYGHLLLEQNSKRQVWIAGGIGVTPFLSYIRSHASNLGKIDFYYMYRGEENAIHLDLLKYYASKNPMFRLYLVNSAQQGRLNMQNVDIDHNTTILMCGPDKMMKNYEKDIHNKCPQATVIYESFGFK